MGCTCDPWLRGSLHTGVTTPCKGVATENLTWKFSKIGGNRLKSPNPKGGKSLGTASERESDARSGLSMSKNSQMELYSFVGVGLGRELSNFESLASARFWTYDPSLRGYDPFIRGSLVKGLYMRPLIKGVAS